MKIHPTSDSDRRGTLSTARRASAALLVFTVLFLFLATRIFCLQVFGYDEAQAKVMEEITVSSALRATRGNIYDASGNLLATEKTVYRIYISPKNIATAEKSRPGILLPAAVSADS